MLAQRTHFTVGRGKYNCTAGLQFDPVVSVYTNNDIFSCLVKSNQVKLETSRSVILPLQ